MSEDGGTASSRADVERVVQQLLGLRATMSPGEQGVLDAICQPVADLLTKPEVQELLKDFPEAPDLLEEVSGFTLGADQMNIAPSPIGTRSTVAILEIPSVRCRAASTDL